MSNNNSLTSTQEFWDASPCDGQSSFNLRRKLRYDKEPWIVGQINEIAQKHDHITEVGCGQGTDALTFCEALSADSVYQGIDLSEKSIASAKNAAKEAKHTLRTFPQFAVGNAESLNFADDTLPCIYSFGVLHHTMNIENAISEIRRVLQPQGKAYIFLYRTMSPKVFIAQILRVVQKIFDFYSRRDRTIYQMLKGSHLEKYCGTLLLECFGVPNLNSYTASQVFEITKSLQIVSLKAIGNNIPFKSINRNIKIYEHPFSVFWRIELEK